MKQPRIAYLTGEYPRATDTFIQREVAQLRLSGFHVETCSIRRTGAEHHVADEQRTEAANTFHVLPATAKIATSLRAHFNAITRAPRRYLRALALAWRTAPAGIKAHIYQLIYFAEAVVLADHLRRENIQHLHNHIAKSSCTVAMLASEIGAIPFSFTLHGPDIFFEPARWRLDEKIARASFVACISHFARSQAMAFSAQHHWPRLHIVHCGIDPARYDRPPSGTGSALLFVGRLAAVKGVPVLFQAMANLLPACPGLHLTLIGDGPERKALESQARAMGLTDALTFTGYLGQNEVAHHLQASDMLVLPSFAEGVPVVLMEAMAARLPVVTTRIAGIPELVHDGVSGALVSPGDVGALTDAIADLLADPAKRQQMGTAGRAHVCTHYNIRAEAAWLGQLISARIANTPLTALRPDPPREQEDR